MAKVRWLGDARLCAGYACSRGEVYEHFNARDVESLLRQGLVELVEDKPAPVAPAPFGKPSHKTTAEEKE